MNIYSSSQVMSNTLPQKNINLPTTVKSIQFRNVSAWSFHIVSSNSEWDILPFSSTIFPVSGNQNLSIIPLTQITFTDINIPLGVSLDYMTQPIASVSSYSLLPIFTGNVNAVIQSGTVDANITNASLSVSGSVDANVSNNSIDTLVINDVSSPANVSQVNGSPIVSAFVSLSTSWQEVVVIGGVAQKILLSTVNATSTQLASDTTIFLSFDNGSSTFAVLLAGAILAWNGTQATAGPFFTIDLSPGVSVSGLYASSNVTDLDIVATVII